MIRGRQLTVVIAAVGVIGAAGAAGALLLRTATPTIAAGAPRYVDETISSGIAHRYDGPSEYQVGGGVAVLDCDGDVRPDLYLAGGAAPAALYRNVSGVGGELRFEHLQGDATDLDRVNGAYPIDLEGDGIADLVVLRTGDPVLLRGRGDCAFEDVTAGLGLAAVGGQITAFSATWEDEAGLPTLAFGRYLTFDAAGEQTFDCDANALVRPSGSGYDSPLTLAPGFCSLSVLFSDWDRSGRRDLRVTNDRQYYRDGMDQLWRIAAGEPPRLYTADDGWVSMQIWGMGIASQDLTGDGYPEVYLTSQGDNKLQTLTAGPSRPTFRDIALRRGVTATQPYAGGDGLPSTAWHPEFADVNDDGFLDLFVSKGNVGQQATHAMRDPSNLFLGQPDGTFIEGALEAGIVTYERGRGAALVDLNTDGLLDLVLMNYGAESIVWRNVGLGTAVAPAIMGRWTAFELRQPGPNRSAIGAWVEIAIGDLVVEREVTIGGGHAGGQLGPMHVGLGPANAAELRVTWPDGEVGPWQRLESGSIWIVGRGVDPVRATRPED
ncbi:MAG: VCBS repeat-containing protein [Chloroflexota bacterium]